MTGRPQRPSVIVCPDCGEERVVHRTGAVPSHCAVHAAKRSHAASYRRYGRLWRQRRKARRGEVADAIRVRNATCRADALAAAAREATGELAGLIAEQQRDDVYYIRRWPGDPWGMRSLDALIDGDRTLLDLVAAS